MTPEGMAVFRAEAPDPVEVDLRQVHRYRDAERLSEQEERTLAAEEAAPAATVSGPKPYRKPLHLVKFHSWAPLYFNYDAVESASMDLSYDTASPGLTGLFQNDLGTAWGAVGYAAHPDEDNPAQWRHSGHLQFTYTGLYPVLEATFDLYDQGVAQYAFQRRLRDSGLLSYATLAERLDGPMWSGSLKAYVPIRLNKDGIQRGIIPQVKWSVSNHLFDNGTVEVLLHEDFVRNAVHVSFSGFTPGRNVLMQNLRGSLRGYWTLPAAESQVYPRLGIGGELGGSFRPGLEKIYSPAWYGYLYGYLPGFTRTQGLRLTASAQFQVPTGASFGENSISVLPRGFRQADGTAIARKSARQFRLTADYALPIYAGDISWFSPVAYITHFLLIPHVDWMAFGGARNGKGTPAASSLLSAGADFTVELANFLWAPFPCSVGVSASWLGGPYYRTLTEGASGRKPWSMEMIFSIDF